MDGSDNGDAIPAPSIVDENPLALIADERTRQVIEEGYDAEHVNDHTFGQLASAAAAYAFPPHTRPLIGAPFCWPWDGWNPSGAHSPTLQFPGEIEGRIRELAKAGALIVAEIERLQRLADKRAARHGQGDTGGAP